MERVETGLRHVPTPDRGGRINKKLAALALAGVFAAGGIGFFASQQGESQTKPEPTPIMGAIGDPDTGTAPAVESTEIVPTELMTEEQKQKAGALNFLWKSANFNSKLGTDVDPIRNSIEIAPLDPEVWEKEIREMIYDDNFENTLVAKFKIGNIGENRDGSNLAQGDKLIGEIELSNVNLELRPRTDKVILTAQLRERGNYYIIPETSVENVEAFLQKDEDQFSNYSSDPIDYEIALSINKEGNGYTVDNIQENWLYVVIWSIAKSSCSDEEGSPCQRKKVEL